MKRKISSIIAVMNPKGLVTLLSAMAVGAIATSIGITLILIAAGSSDTARTLAESKQANSLAHGCAEKALQKLWDDDAYLGSEQINIGQGSCSYVIEEVGWGRKIKSTGTVADSFKKVEVSVASFNPTIEVSSWKEVAEFQ